MHVCELGFPRYLLAAPALRFTNTPSLLGTAILNLPIVGEVLQNCLALPCAAGALRIQAERALLRHRERLARARHREASSSNHISNGSCA